MATYQRPLQPWDPVVPDQQIKPPIRFVRDNFQGTGQDSHTQAPAQDPSMWQALTNVQPITKGVIERRWGYNQLASGITSGANKLALFQRDSDGLRTILTQGPGQVQAYTESGSLYSSVFQPSGSVVRSLSSRNYQYFFDGLAMDLKKWNGNVNTGVSNWGIDASNVTINQAGGGTSPTTFGPNSGNINNQSFRLITQSMSNQTSATVPSTSYGFSLGGGTVAGIVVSMTISFGGNFIGAAVTTNLLKNGLHYGDSKGVGTNINTSGTYTFGSPTDLWGGGWLPLDINAANFGIQFYASGSAVVTPQQGGPPFYNLDVTISISNITITVYTVPSGSGVTITSISGGGAVNLTIGRTYYLAFFNANTGHFSDLNPASVSTGPVVNGSIVLILPTNNDPQVTHKYLLATADGNDPSVLYQVAELTNGGAGDVTTYTDTLIDSSLVLNQVFLYTDQSGTEFGVSLNDPPPPGTLCIKHQGRLWMAGVAGATHSVFFSKAVGDLTLPNGFIAGKYEEAWPGNNYFDISDGAESVAGLLSDGQTLYIGSQFHIRRLTGNDPINFGLPEIVHPQVGLVNQETWQLVYTQGSPAGAMWMTPDFRIIQSDFNTYIDIGAKIQDILNNLAPTARALAHASFVGAGEYDLYILAVPFAQTTYCDLHLVYDLRHQNWFIWQPTNGSLALVYNVTLQGAPQWLFIGGNQANINQYVPSTLTDNGSPFTTVAQTSWLSLGEPSHRKLLNELEVNADPTMTVSIQGALTAGDFLIPKSIVTNQSSVLGPLGTLKFFVAAIGSNKYKYYQFIFQSNSIVTPIMLNSYNIEVVPVSDL